MNQFKLVSCNNNNNIVTHVDKIETRLMQSTVKKVKSKVKIVDLTLSISLSLIAVGSFAFITKTCDTVSMMMIIC